jgi:hypothetical protein
MVIILKATSLLHKVDNESQILLMATMLKPARQNLRVANRPVVSRVRSVLPVLMATSTPNSLSGF